MPLPPQSTSRKNCPSFSIIARLAIAFFLLALSTSVQGFAVTHVATARKTHKAAGVAVHSHLTPRFRVHFRAFNPMFPGSHDLLVKQNEELDRLQLPRINDDYELMRFELAQTLVPVSESDALKIAADLPDNRRYCRPWTRDFLQDFSNAFYNEFHTPLQVNSLVRTVEQQHRWNTTDLRHQRSVTPRQRT